MVDAMVLSNFPIVNCDLQTVGNKYDRDCGVDIIL